MKVLDRHVESEKWTLETVLAEVVGPSRPTSEQITKLRNMWPERAKVIIREMQKGVSYKKSEKASEGVYDTCDWGEIRSRLWRARGNVLGNAARLACFGSRIIQSDDDKQVLESLASLMRDDAQLQLAQVANFPIEATDNSPCPSDTPNLSEFDAKKLVPFGKLVGKLVAGSKFLKKNNRDILLIPEKLGIPPTLSQRARINVELSRITSGANLLLQLLNSAPVFIPTDERPTSAIDLLGVGVRYAAWFDSFLSRRSGLRTVATHREPDADALVAAWMVVRYLYPTETCRVTFVSRDFELKDDSPFDCVVDVGRMHVVKRLWFDHKPPAFEHRDQTCATRLVWDHLRRQRKPVEHLTELVDLVHDGDAATRRGQSAAYRKSQLSGLHGHIRHARRWAENDQMLFQAIAMWLDAEYRCSVQPV